MTTKQAATIERMWHEGATIAEIARDTGLNASTVASYAHYHRESCPRRTGGRVSGWQRLEMVRLREEGYTVKRVAYRLGVSESTVVKHTKGVAVPKSERHVRLELLWASGVALSDIARLTGMTETAVATYASSHRESCPHRRRADVERARVQARRMRDEGLTVAEIASRMGCSPANVYATYLKGWKRGAGDGVTCR